MPQLWHSLKSWLRFHPWPGNLHKPQVQLKKKRKNKSHTTWSSLVAQWVKDPVLSLRWLRSLLWQVNPWPWNFHMVWVQSKQNKTKQPPPPKSLHRNVYSSFIHSLEAHQISIKWRKINCWGHLMEYYADVKKQKPTEVSITAQWK